MMKNLKKLFQEKTGINQEMGAGGFKKIEVVNEKDLPVEIKEIVEAKDESKVEDKVDNTQSDLEKELEEIQNKIEAHKQNEIKEVVVEEDKQEEVKEDEVGEQKIIQVPIFLSRGDLSRMTYENNIMLKEIINNLNN